MDNFNDLSHSIEDRINLLNQDDNKLEVKYEELKNSVDIFRIKKSEDITRSK